MKKIYLYTAILWGLLKLISVFMISIVSLSGIYVVYISIIMFYVLYILVFINIAHAAIFIIRARIWNIFKRKKKELTTFQWAGEIKNLDKEMKLLLGCVKVSDDIIDNIGVLKKRIGYYFNNDIKKMKRYKAYLSVVEKDNTPLIIQTFIIAIFSSAFASALVTGKIQDVIEFFMPLKEAGVQREAIPLEFYYVSGIMFLFLLAVVMISFLIIFTDKTKIRMVQKVIDVYIDEEK
ncbi:hypothetical protein ABEX53_10625 [Bacillus toyonensis]|uniref:hypothetical protein n=1 Tax=Bacillus toyonensis TaxID=155322 RepID=UPI000CD7FB2F|nr:hypothetical protein [Bacillus toyonensis]MED3541328.1 hypothetical protein [Bacillus toyonensis]MEE2021841.1 hypothetical protein [Bacillus toyonensis]